MFPIAISLAPNLKWADVTLSLKYLLWPGNWFKLSSGVHIKSLEQTLEKYFSAPQALVFASGREALLAALKQLNLSPGSEVLIQGYTCIVVPNAVIWAGLKPIYVDIEAESFNVSPKEVEAKLTPQTKVLIIQHTFGKPANLKQLLKIARQHKLIVIEDCAHALGSTYQGQKIGTFGDLAIFSFGRDKVISAVHGGALVVNNRGLVNSLKEYQQTRPLAKRFEIIQHLMHSVVCYLGVLPWYNWQIGKLILVLAQKLKLISKVFAPGEKQAQMPVDFPRRLPNALAHLAEQQFGFLEEFSNRRQQVVNQYHHAFQNLPSLKLPKLEACEKSSWMRYSLQTSEARKLLQFAKKEHMILGNWYDCPIAPKGAAYQKVGYQPGSCPIAEKVAAETINLPTYARLTNRQIKQIIKVVRIYFSDSIS